MIKSREEEDYILTPLCRSPVSPQCEERGRGKEERRVPPPLICPSIHPDIYLSIHPSVRLSILTGRSRWAQSGGQRSLRSEGEEEDEDDDHDGDQHADGTPLSATWDTHTHTGWHQRLLLKYWLLFPGNSVPTVLKGTVQHIGRCLSAVLWFLAESFTESS